MYVFFLLQTYYQNSGVLMRTEWLYICLVHTTVLKKKQDTIFLMASRKGKNKWNYLAANIYRTNVTYIKYTSASHTIPANS